MPSLMPHVQPAPAQPVHAQIERRGAEPSKTAFADLLDVGTIQPDPNAAPTRTSRNHQPQQPAKDSDTAPTANAAGGGQDYAGDTNAAAQNSATPATPNDANTTSDAEAATPAEALVGDGDADNAKESDSPPTQSDASSDLANTAAVDALATPVVQTQAATVATVVPVAAPPVLLQSAVGAATSMAGQNSAVEVSAAAANVPGVTLASAPAASAISAALVASSPKSSAGPQFNLADGAQASSAAASDPTANPNSAPEDAAASAAMPPAEQAEHLDNSIKSAEIDKFPGGQDTKDSGADKLSVNPVEAATTTETLLAAHSNAAAQTASSTTATSAAAQPPPAAGLQTVVIPMGVPLAGLAVEIATRSRDGKNRFEIRLDPPELGRIDVRLDVDRHGNVTSRLVVERADTLDLLRRDAASLERALSDAGLKTGDNSLQFSLRNQSFAGDNRRDAPMTNFNRILVPTGDPIQPEPARYRLARLGGIDIRV